MRLPPLLSLSLFFSFPTSRRKRSEMVAIRICALALSLAVCAGCVGVRAPAVVVRDSSAGAAISRTTAGHSPAVIEHSATRPVVVRAAAPEMSVADVSPGDLELSVPPVGPKATGSAEIGLDEALPAEAGRATGDGVTANDAQGAPELFTSLLGESPTVNTRIGDVLDVVVDEPGRPDAPTADTRWLRAQAAE